MARKIFCLVHHNILNHVRIQGNTLRDMDFCLVWFLVYIVQRDNWTESRRAMHRGPTYKLHRGWGRLKHYHWFYTSNGCTPIQVLPVHQAYINSYFTSSWIYVFQLFSGLCIEHRDLNAYTTIHCTHLGHLSRKQTKCIYTWGGIIGVSGCNVRQEIPALVYTLLMCKPVLLLLLNWSVKGVWLLMQFS